MRRVVNLLSNPREHARTVLNDSLLRNTFFLLLSMGVNAGLGFFFWIIVTHYYSAATVGLASTMIASLGLLTQFSLLGLNIGVVRYIRDFPRSSLLTVAFVGSALAALVTASIFLVILPSVSPTLMLLRENTLVIALFIVTVVLMTWFVLMSGVFNSLLANQWILLQNIIFSVGKLILPALLVGFGAWGMFGSWVISGSVATLVCISILVVKFDYRPTWRADLAVAKAVFPYSVGNYLEGFIGSLPILLLPLIVTNTLGTETTAYFSIAMTIAGMVFFVPQAAAQTMFAEGANDPEKLLKLFYKTRKMVFLLVTVIVLAVLVLAKPVLSVFGEEYAFGAAQFLQLLALSSFIVAYNGMFAMVMRLQNRVKSLLVISSLFAASVLLTVYSIDVLTLKGVALSWIAGHLLVAVIYTVLFWGTPFALSKSNMPIAADSAVSEPNPALPLSAPSKKPRNSKKPSQSKLASKIASRKSKASPKTKTKSKRKLAK